MYDGSTYEEMERIGLHRYRLRTLSLVLIWVGAIEVGASLLAKVWFQYTLQISPLFLSALLAGVCLYVVARVM